MEHKHQYETIYRHAVTAQVAELGIKGAEVRKCTKCSNEMIFVFIKEEWVPLFEDGEGTEQDILLA